MPCFHQQQNLQVIKMLLSIRQSISIQKYEEKQIVKFVQLSNQIQLTISKTAG